MAAYAPAPFFTARRRRGFLAGPPPAGQYDEARRVLGTIAAYMDLAIDSESSGDQATADQVLEELATMDAGTSWGWDEGMASQREALGVLRSYFYADRLPEPSMWNDVKDYAGAGDQVRDAVQVEGFKQAAQAVSVRIRNRAESSDFVKPALTVAELQDRDIDPSSWTGGLIDDPADVAALAQSDQSWAKKVEQDERNARKQMCSPLTVLTGEQSAVSYLENCVGVPWWAKWAAGGVGALMVYGIYRRVSGR